MSANPTLRRMLATAAVLAAVLGVAPAALAEARVPAKTTAVVVEHDTVRMVLTVPALPEGDTLDPTSVRVSAGGTTWPATAKAVAGSGGTVKRTAVLAVDTSGSMGPAGIADARVAASRFLEVVPADVSVGLVTFADKARLVVPPTSDRGAVRAALAGMRPEGDTTLYDGIGLALSALGRSGDRALILLSDGKDTTSRASLSSTRAALARSGISVDLVSFGSGDQRKTLDQLAAAAKGRVTQADNGAQLAAVFASAARTLVNTVTVTAQIPPEVTAEVADLTVEIDAETSTAVADLQVALPAPARRAPIDSAGTVAGTPSVVPTNVPWLLPVVLVVAFLGLFMLFSVGFTPETWRESSSQRGTRRIQRYAINAAALPSAGEAAPAATTQVALAWAARTVASRGVEESWSTELDRAAVPLRAPEWLIVRLAASLCGVALGVLFLPWWLITAPIAGIATWLLAGAYVRIKAKRRLNRFAENLPDVLQLIAGSLRSGFSLPQAVDNAAKDGEQPMAGELSRALAESRLGVDLEDALDRVAVRMRSTDMTWTIMAVRIAREVGGNLAEVLMSTSETMRERSRIQRQVKVLSAEGRLSAYILIGLPVGITLWMVLFRRDYVAPLVTDPIGLVMTTYGILSVLFGAWWMSRLIKLEV